MMATSTHTNTVGGEAVSKRFYSERDLAAVLGLSIKTIQGWRFRGHGPAWRRLCGAVRYDVVEFDTWVQAQPGGGGQTR